jgi:hypothetical protein
VWGKCYGEIVNIKNLGDISLTTNLLAIFGDVQDM